MYRAHINIGANLGDRCSTLERAVGEVGSLCAPGTSARVSDTVESEPWGFHSEHAFLNVGLEITTNLPPLQLLHALQRIERSFSSNSHRNLDGSYRDRLIDIDIIYMQRLRENAPDDDVIVDAPELTLPHPRAHLRPFVLQPLQQLSPFWQHPLQHLTPSQLLQRIKKEE